MAVFHGSRHDDNLTGTSDDDVFALYKGGNDTVSGGDGSDRFDMGGALNAADRLDGGTGNDVVFLRGDYSANLAFDDQTIRNIEVLKLGNGFDYDLATADGNVAAGETLSVNARALGTANSLVFDGSREMDGHFVIYAGSGGDTITGGALGDRFNLATGGDDTVHGGGGRDVFAMGGAFTAADTIDGGAGNDTLTIDGNYASVAVSAGHVTGVEALRFLGGHSYTGVSVTGDVAGGAALTVDAGLAGKLSVDLGAATSSAYAITGSGGNDTIAFAGNFSSADAVDGGAGSDTLELNGDYSAGIAFGAATMISVETLKLDDGFGYKLATDDATVASGAALTVDASTLGAAHSLVLDGASETDGGFAVSGGAGDDTVTLGARGVLAGSTFDGGAGRDKLVLDGDFSANLVFGAATVTHVEEIDLAGGHSYSLATNDGNVVALATLTVDASALLSGDALTFNGAAELDGNFAITGGAGDDSLSGGAQADMFLLQNGGADTVHGGGGDDTIVLAGTLTAGDAIDGGTGNDTVSLVENGTIAFGLATLTNVERLNVDSDDHIAIATNDGTVAPGATMTVDFTASSAAGGVYAFDGSAETDGHFAIAGPAVAGSFSASGGALSDTFTLGNDGTASNTIHGNGGSDTLTLTSLGMAVTYDGGSGNDTLSLIGGGTPAMSGYTLTSVETLKLDDDNWAVTTVDGNVSAGATLTVDAGALGASHTLTFDGSAETNGAFAVIAGAGNDAATGGSGSDSFDFTKGGNDAGHGGAGNDTFSFGAAFTSADTIDGGANNDTISLDGDYAAGLVLGAATITGIENIVMAAGHSYGLTTDDANVAGAATLTLNASALGAGELFAFDGSAETDGFFNVLDGAGNDTVSGGAQSDTFASLGGTDTFDGNGGNDTFNMRAALTAADAIDGGSGSDTLNLDGDYSAGLTFGTSTVLNVETIALAAGHSYNLTTNDATVGGGATLTVNGAALGASDSLVLNGLAETGGFFAITGGAGSDGFTIGPRNVLAGSTIDGGAGSDTLTLNGNYGSALTLGANTIKNIETIVFAPVSSNYIFVANDATVAAGQTLTLDATALTRALSWNALAETDGFYNVKGGAGADVFMVGSETVLAGSTFDGGSGNNILELSGDFSTHFVFGADTITSIPNLTLDRNHSYDLKTVDANIAGGGALFVNGLALTATDTLHFDGSAEADGHFTLEGGQGGDTLIGGAGNDTLWGYVGADTMTGGAGADTFFYTFAVGSGVAESTSTHYDTITDIDFSVDRIDPPSANGHVTEVDTAILGGTLSTASFDADLAGAVDGGHLAVNGAVLFTADSGSLTGHTFLVVDENGVAGYQAGADLVIDVTGYSGTLTTGSFI